MDQFALCWGMKGALCTLEYSQLVMKVDFGFGSQMETRKVSFLGQRLKCTVGVLVGYKWE